MNKFLLSIVLLLPNFSFIEFSHSESSGIHMTISSGIPQMRILTDTQEANYSGYSLQGELSLPILTYGILETDLNFSYLLNSLENGASTFTQSEWSHQNGWGSGLRFRLSYIQLGAEYQFMRGKHLKAGSSNEIFEYNYTPLRWYIGLHIPLSPVTNFGVTYSQTTESRINTQNSEIRLSDQAVWVNIQINFGITFLNLFKVNESFETTGSGFFGGN